MLKDKLDTMPQVQDLRSWQVPDGVRPGPGQSPGQVQGCNPWAVLVSGGVDSSVALARLCAAGHRVTAFYLKIWLEDELSFLGECPWEEDLAYVREVCKQLNVPLEVIPLQQVYWERVVAYVIDAIKKGQTPNPDMLCNQQVKFGAFCDAIGDEFEKVATGHYAQVGIYNGHWHLSCSPDAVKDQTYFLAYLSQLQLSRALFPIGHLTKEQVRAEAAAFKLPNAQRKDSQGICFLGKVKFSEFINFHVGEQQGELIEFETGKVVGEHRGFWFYTIGQRQGIGLSGGPWYVVSKDVTKNRVFISRNYYAPDKQRRSFYIHGCNWFSGTAPLEQTVDVKLRHGAQRQKAQLEPVSKDVFKVQLCEKNDQGIAVGQFAVFYDDTLCLGGGIITEKE